MLNQSTLQAFDPNAAMNTAASSSTVITESLETGGCQMAILNQNTFVSDVATGVINLTEVAVDEGSLPYSVIVGANTTYTSLSQLKTATWVNTGPGSQSAISEEILWGQQGWDASSITQIVSSSASGSLTAVIDGQAADFSTTSQAVPQLLGGQIRAVYNETFPWPIEVLVATPSYVSANPTAVHAAVDAFLYANGIVNNKAEQSYIDQLVVPNFPGYTAAEVNALYTPPINNFPVNGAISISALQDLINYQLEYGAISKNISATSLITTGYVPVTS